MSLEDIIQQINSSAENEIEKIKKETPLKIKELNQKFEEEIQKIKSEKKEALEKKKKQFLERKKEEEWHRFAMKTLSVKNEILNEAFEKIKKRFKSLGLKEKKEVLKKEIQKIRHLIGQDTVFISKNRQEAEEILQELEIFKAGAIEERPDLHSDFLIEDKNWSVEISLEGTVEEILKENKNNFAKILWQN